MINVMIVDDEERARTGIRTLIDWNSRGIAIAAEARDGVEALSCFAKPRSIFFSRISGCRKWTV
ncbi:hypothetical protein LJK88_15795 [Paenibacillus sp. P26]|nr:hypothetical protein LJK88_15795 [Paenibacillus sp. P26]